MFVDQQGEIVTIYLNRKILKLNEEECRDVMTALNGIFHKEAIKMLGEVQRESGQSPSAAIPMRPRAKRGRKTGWRKKARRKQIKQAKPLVQEPNQELPEKAPEAVNTNPEALSNEIN